MTNEQMAKNLVGNEPLSSIIPNANFEKVALEMAKWKDEQFKDAVDKAMKYLEINLQLTEAESTHIRNIFQNNI